MSKFCSKYPGCGCVNIGVNCYDKETLEKIVQGAPYTSSFKEKINIYECPSGHQTITVDRVEGTTPMMIRCKQRHADGKHNCTEFAESHWYRCDQSLVPEYEWYKPQSMKGLNAGEREHVNLGGLLLRKIKKD